MNRKDSSKHRMWCVPVDRLVHKSAWYIWRLRRQLPATSSRHIVIWLAVVKNYDWCWLAQAFALGATETTTETTFFRSTDSASLPERPRGAANNNNIQVPVACTCKSRKCALWAQYLHKGGWLRCLGWCCDCADTKFDAYTLPVPIFFAGWGVCLQYLQWLCSDQPVM